MNGHIDDMAELYALGALEADQAQGILAHAETCAECRRALARAETTVAALDAAFVPHVAPPEGLGASIRATVEGGARVVAMPSRARRIPAALAGLAAAAAFALGLAGGAGFVVSREDPLHAAIGRQDLALMALVHSHFNHVQMQRAKPGAPDAKVLYARDGAWVYVIVDRANCGCRVEALHGAATVDLGEPQAAPGGTSASVFDAQAAQPDGITLVDANGAAIASAKLVYDPAKSH